MDRFSGGKLWCSLFLAVEGQGCVVCEGCVVWEGCVVREGCVVWEGCVVREGCVVWTQTFLSGRGSHHNSHDRGTQLRSSTADGRYWNRLYSQNSSSCLSFVCRTNYNVKIDNQSFLFEQVTMRSLYLAPSLSLKPGPFHSMCSQRSSQGQQQIL